MLLKLTIKKNVVFAYPESLTLMRKEWEEGVKKVGLEKEISSLSYKKWIHKGGDESLSLKCRAVRMKTGISSSTTWSMRGVLTFGCTWWQKGWGAASAGSPLCRDRAPCPEASSLICCKTSAAQTPESLCKRQSAAGFDLFKDPWQISRKLNTRWKK